MLPASSGLPCPVLSLLSASFQDCLTQDKKMAALKSGECSQIRFLQKNVEHIIRKSSTGVYATNVYKKPRRSGAVFRIKPGYPAVSPQQQAETLYYGAACKPGIRCRPGAGGRR